MNFSKSGGISNDNFLVLCKQNDPGNFKVVSLAFLIEGKSEIANMELETYKKKEFWLDVQTNKLPSHSFSCNNILGVKLIIKYTALS